MPSRSKAAIDMRRHAKSLVFQAWDSVDPQERGELAAEAIRLDKDCVDAWNLLGEQAQSYEKSLEYYESGEAAGRRELGKEFDELVGHFWGVHETRPFMRSLQGKAEVLTAMGHNQQAIAVYQEMLKLNANDNQGVRWCLMGLLLQLNLNQSASDLIDQYPDDAYILWPLAELLLAIRSNATDNLRRQLLKKAFESNPYFVDFLVARRDIQEKLPSTFVFGDESEVLSAMPLLLPAWKSTAGAVAWLRKAVAKAGFEPPENAESAPATAGMSARTKTMVASAGEVDQDPRIVWQVDYRKSKVGDDFIWNVVGACSDQQEIIGHVTLETCPKLADVWEAILSMIVAPGNGHPMRPGRIEFAKKTVAKGLKKRLERLAVTSTVKSLEVMETIFEMIEQMSAAGQLDETADPTTVAVEDDLVWQVGAFQLPTPVEDHGDIIFPTSILVFDPGEEAIMTVGVAGDEVQAEDISEQIRQAIFANPMNVVVKPATVEVMSNDQAINLRPIVNAWGIKCEVAKDFVAFGEAVDGLISHFSGGPQLFVSAVADVSPEDHRRFYHSATAFFKAAPWNRSPGDRAYRIFGDSLDFDVYVIPMGQMGSVLGLAVYTSLAEIRRGMSPGAFAENETSVQANGQQGRVWSMMFCESHEISPREMHSVETLGLPVAGPEAYPSLLELVDGAPMPVPGPREVHLIATCLDVMSAAIYPATDPQSIAVGDVVLKMEAVKSI